jgi:hypothetical protein
MKTAIAILIILASQMLNAQEIDTVYDEPTMVSLIVIGGGNPYLNSETVNAKYKIIKKYEKTFEDPLDDYFWPKTPGELWDTNVRNYIITLNNKGDYNLFVLDNDSFNSLDVGMYFQFLPFMELGSIYSDLGKYNKEEIKKEISKFF